MKYRFRGHRVEGTLNNATCTAEGHSRATARGQHMEPPPALTTQQQVEARQRRAEGATLRELAQPRRKRRDDFHALHLVTDQVT